MGKLRDFRRPPLRDVVRQPCSPGRGAPPVSVDSRLKLSEGGGQSQLDHHAPGGYLGRP